MDATASEVIDDSGAASKQPKRDPDLWFEDGNIVVQAEDHEFCLLKSFLTKRSPIFRDVFSLPQPEDAERINGCPVVRIHDSGEDAAHFFKAIFDPESFLPSPLPTTLDKVAAILRLSTKYEVEYLRKRAMIHLSSGYATSLNDREKIKSLATFPILPRDAIVAINVAREVDCPWILPSAFYDYCKHVGPQEIFSGTQRDGVLLSLSDDDKKICLGGRESQREASKNSEIFLTAPAPEDCLEQLGARCAKGRWVWAHFLNTQRQGGICLDPMETWEHWENFGGHVCAPCLKACQKQCEDRRQAVWLSIPTMFGLPSWTELEAKKTAQGLTT